MGSIVHSPDSEEFSDDGTIQRIKNDKCMNAKSKGIPDTIVWPNVQQAMSTDEQKYSNDYLGLQLMKLIREQVIEGRPIRKMVPPPSATKREVSKPFGITSADYSK